MSKITDLFGNIFTSVEELVTAKVDLRNLVRPASAPKEPWLQVDASADELADMFLQFLEASFDIGRPGDMTALALIRAADIYGRPDVVWRLASQVPAWWSISRGGFSGAANEAHLETMISYLIHARDTARQSLKDSTPPCAGSHLLVWSALAVASLGLDEPIRSEAILQCRIHGEAMLSYAKAFRRLTAITKVAAMPSFMAVDAHDEQVLKGVQDTLLFLASLTKLSEQAQRFVSIPVGVYLSQFDLPSA